MLVCVSLKTGNCPVYHLASSGFLVDQRSGALARGLRYEEPELIITGSDFEERITLPGLNGDGAHYWFRIGDVAGYEAAMRLRCEQVLAEYANQQSWWQRLWKRKPAA